MKKITLLLALLVSTAGFSQEVLQDFELPGSVFDAFGGAVVTLVPDPAPVTGELRRQVALITTPGTADAWQGINVVLTKNLGLTTVKTITIDAYSLSPLSFAPKAQGGLEGAPDSVASATHTGSGWETITVSFTESLASNSPANGVYTKFAIHALWDTTSNNFLAPVNRDLYVDNITGIAVEEVVISGPSTDAPIPPTRAAADVISIFSDSYTDISGTNYTTTWNADQGTQVNVNYDPTSGGNNTALQYSQFDYQGIIFGAPFPDASEMENLHIDVWTDVAGTVLTIKPMDNGGGAGGVETVAVVNIPIVNAGWSSVDLARDSFSAMAWGSIFQIVMDATSGTDPTVVYIDNLYFWKASTAGLEDFSANAVKMYPNPAKGVVNFSSASNEVLDVAVYDMLGKQVLRANAVQSQLNISSLNPGMYFVNMTQGSKVSTKKLLVN